MFWPNILLNLFYDFCVDLSNDGEGGRLGVLWQYLGWVCLFVYFICLFVAFHLICLFVNCLTFSYKIKLLEIPRCHWSWLNLDMNHKHILRCFAKKILIWIFAIFFVQLTHWGCSCFSLLTVQFCLDQHLIFLLD